MGGKSGGGSTVVAPQRESNPYSKQLADMASGLWSQTQPIRDSFTNQYFMPFLQGNYNPETLPGFKPGYNLARSGFENQYNVAKQNIEASTPRGGSMTNALAGLEYNRAKSIGDATAQLSSNLVGDLWNKAYNTGWVTAPSQAFTGMGTAGTQEQSGINQQLNAQMQAAQITAAQQVQEQQAKNSGMGLLGSGIGSLIGMAASPITGGISGAKGGSSSGSGITSGLGGYSTLASQARPLGW